VATLFLRKLSATGALGEEAGIRLTAGEHAAQIAQEVGLHVVAIDQAKQLARTIRRASRLGHAAHECGNACFHGAFCRTCVIAQKARKLVSKRGPDLLKQRRTNIESHEIPSQLDR
jgi:hypothetical protein